jgi:hypothetical protein
VGGHKDCISREQAQAVVLGQLGYNDVLAMRDQAWQRLGSGA